MAQGDPTSADARVSAATWAAPRSAARWSSRGLSCITTTSTLASEDRMSIIDSIIGRFMPPMSTGFR